MEKQISDLVMEFIKHPDKYNLERLRDLHTGEQNYIDFKREWMADYDTLRHIIGFANSGGGCILIGVEEDSGHILNFVGLKNFTDKTKFQEKLSKHISSELKYEIHDITTDKIDNSDISDKKFQAIIIFDNPAKIPFVVLKDFDESGSKKIKAGDIYCRSKVSTNLVNQSDLENIFKRKVEALMSEKTTMDFKDHIDQLKVLYDSIKEFKYESIFDLSSILQRKTENDNFPEESFDEFISKMIDCKKKRIEEIVKK
jgi:predicted HTH transcriptional regulator